MDLFSKLTPAETYLLLHDDKAHLKDLMKFTLMDLFYKGVLQTSEIQKKAHPRDKVRTSTYIVIGDNFNTYTPLSHELVFLEPYIERRSLRVLFRQLIKLAYENTSSPSVYIRTKLMTSPMLTSCFKAGLLNVIFNTVRMNSNGKELQEKLLSSLGEIEKNFPDWIENDQNKALEVLEIMQGNVFLLSDTRFKLLNKIDKALIKELQRGREVYSLGLAYWIWDFYADYDSIFDSGFDAADSGGWGGGDSGCSGCGGCGS